MKTGKHFNCNCSQLPLSNSLQVNFDPGQDFFWCENKAKVIPRPCDSTSGNSNQTSVREKSRGVYLAIG